MYFLNTAAGYYNNCSNCYYTGGHDIIDNINQG